MSLVAQPIDLQGLWFCFKGNFLYFKWMILIANHRHCYIL
ncbi:hypothetical protein HMPREF0454_03991 [Hafnia alvei ATCC 51873]|uniref:Uncharacterized protein n=1 Tax=Hafnia alvei ATCC 51873 TaxID=1002364 RepID=G9YBU8_HAFAL|nr:hypothetical protein HMPREF0454_03991 [Hafnia alvei ATCC 51873]